MKIALHPDNDLERIQNLMSYNILDSSAEPTFDNLLSLAASISNCPMAAISFIDQQRLWFKSRIGIPVTETPRDISICGHAIHGTDFFQINDLLADSRFFDNPLITGELHLRYYGGVPLLSQEGFVLGVLCVMHNRPYALTPEQIEHLQAIARQVMVNLHLRKSIETVKCQQDNLSWLGKMASLGEFAAVTSHEINNAAFIIGAKLESLKISLNEDSPSRILYLSQELETLCKVSQKMNAIILGIRNFSRNDDHSVETIPIKKLIEDTMVLCKEKIKYTNTKLILNLSEPESEIICAATPISQILINLVHNSLDAIQTIPEKWIEISVHKVNENELEFCVTDSGLGIPADIQKNLMQSFFTTKERGKGTGLGLSISKSIAQTHGGDLYYDSGSLHTKFVLRLPIHPK